MFDTFEKILIGILVTCAVVLFICYGVIIYKTATDDEKFFAKRVYIVNQDFCKEDK